MSGNSRETQNANNAEWRAPKTEAQPTTEDASLRADQAVSDIKRETDEERSRRENKKVDELRQSVMHGSGPSSRGMAMNRAEGSISDIAELNNSDFQSFKQTWDSAVKAGRDPKDSLRMNGASKKDVAKIGSPEDAWLLAQGKSKIEKFFSNFGSDLKGAITKFTAQEMESTGTASEAGREVLKDSGKHQQEISSSTSGVGREKPPGSR